MFLVRCFQAFLVAVACVSSINPLLTTVAQATEPIVEVLIGPTVAQPTSEDTAVGRSPLNAPFAVCFEPDGAMWIVEYDGGRLMRFTTTGELVHVAGDGQLGYSDGSAKSARFNKLHNVIRLPDGRLLMSDHRNNAIRSYDPATELVSTYSGSGESGFVGDGGPAAAARLNEPICIELAADQNSLLIADIRNNRIRFIDLGSGNIGTLAGTGEKAKPIAGQPAKQQPLFDPRAAISSGDGGYYVLDRSGHQLLTIDADGIIHPVAGNGKPGFVDGAGTMAQLNGPKHMCLGPENVVFVADDNNNAIRQFNPKSGQLSTVDLGPYTLNRPHGVAVKDGWLYIADSYNHRILRTKLSTN